MRIFSMAVALLGVASVTTAISFQATAADSPVAIEYYDLGLKHYFITAATDEIQALNSGRFFGWVPTGLSFPVLAPDATNPGSTPVCRFYGNPAAGLDSHFYSADPSECKQVQLRFPGGWLLESWNVFRAYLPDMTSGTCPAGTTPIFRLWNNRPDVNHRYTDRADVAQAMIDIGYVPEGYGPSLIPAAFCAPASNVAAMSCTVRASSLTPVIGSTVTLIGTCNGNATHYTWSGCTSSSATCVTTSAVPGTQNYIVTAGNGSANSAPAGISLVWQAGAGPLNVACSLATSNAAPFVNTSITLTASCTGNAASFSWVGCTSSTNLCVTTSASAGARNYAVTASNAANNTSAPTAISINWQAIAPPPAGTSCALDASNTMPLVGSSITLTAACTGNPTSYTWTGCTSSSSTCTFTSATAGNKSYSATASNGVNTSAPATIDVNWQVVPPPPAGMPTSADYLPKVQDSRAKMGFGASAGFSAMKRLANGNMIVFGMSHTPNENNAVETYDPVANAWTVRIPHTVASWPLVPGTVAGRTFLGNRDNQVNIPLRENGMYYVNDGQRGANFDANWRGWVDTSAWTWAGIVDAPSALPLFGSPPAAVWNGVGEWIEALHVGVIYGGTQGQTGDYLNIITPTPGGPNRFAITNFYPDQGGNPSFPGAVKLRYMSQSNWVRGNKIHIYGGQVQDRATGAVADNATIYELDVTNPSAPAMRPVSTNTLPASVQVKGDGILADWFPSKDMAVMTDGRNVNVYDYASGTWVYVPISTPPGANGLSPDPIAGTGLQARWAPEIDQLIVLGLNGATYGLKLNFGAAPPQGTNPTINSFSASPGSIVAGASVVLSASIANATTLQIDGNTVSLPLTVSPLATHTYTLTALGAPGTIAGTATTTVTVTVAPPPPPPPGGPTVGSLTMTATPIAYSGVGGVLGASKHLDFARLGNRWYKIGGDHGATGSPLDAAIPPASDQGGRQEILSLNVPANDWREDTPYYLPASYGVQGADPDDTAFSVVVGNEIWVSNSATNHGIQQPAGAATQVPLLGNIGAYSPPSTQWPLGHWRIVNTAPSVLAGDRAWRGFYDPVKNRVVIPVTWGGSLVWCILDGSTGADLTAYTAGVPNTQGNHTFSVAGVATDFTRRKFYMYDVLTSELWQADMDTLAFSKVADIPEPGAGTQAAIKIAWHPDRRAVVIAATRIHAYEVDSNKLTSWTRPDGFTDPEGNYVPTSAIFFDPDSHDIVSIGTIDFADESQVSNKYWRLTIH